MQDQDYDGDVQVGQPGSLTQPQANELARELAREVLEARLNPDVTDDAGDTLELAARKRLVEIVFATNIAHIQTYREERNMPGYVKEEMEGRVLEHLTRKLLSMDSPRPYDLTFLVEPGPDGKPRNFMGWCQRVIHSKLFTDARSISRELSKERVAGDETVLERVGTDPDLTANQVACPDELTQDKLLRGLGAYLGSQHDPSRQVLARGLAAAHQLKIDPPRRLTPGLMFDARSEMRLNPGFGAAVLNAHRTKCRFDVAVKVANELNWDAETAQKIAANNKSLSQDQDDLVTCYLRACIEPLPTIPSNSLTQALTKISKLHNSKIADLFVAWVTVQSRPRKDQSDLVKTDQAVSDLFGGITPTEVEAVKSAVNTTDNLETLVDAYRKAVNIEQPDVPTPNNTSDDWFVGNLKLEVSEFLQVLALPACDHKIGLKLAAVRAVLNKNTCADQGQAGLTKRGPEVLAWNQACKTIKMDRQAASNLAYRLYTEHVKTPTLGSLMSAGQRDLDRDTARGQRV